LGEFSPFGRLFEALGDIFENKVPEEGTKIWPKQLVFNIYCKGNWAI
jgi:hypothetical protein